MTFGVPYSFVPGTKAKADEVNANFIDVLTKIEDTNTRIDDANASVDIKNAEIDEKFTQVDEAIAKCADSDFSNLSSTAQAKFDEKANAADIDGIWTKKSYTIFKDVNLNGSSYLDYSLSSYLPSDGNVYEVFVQGYGVTAASSANIVVVSIGSSLTGTTPVCRGHSANATAISCGGSCIIPVGTDRSITLVRTVNYNGSGSLIANAYRKVR